MENKNAPISLFRSPIVRVLVAIVAAAVVKNAAAINEVTSDGKITSAELTILGGDLFVSLVAASAIALRVNDRAPVFTPKWMPGPNIEDYADSKQR